MFLLNLLSVCYLSLLVSEHTEFKPGGRATLDLNRVQPGKFDLRLNLNLLSLLT